MKNPYFLLLIALLIIPLSVQAVTVINPRFNQTLNAGSSASFDMIFSPDKGELNVYFERIEVTGDCAGWVKTNKTSMQFINKTPVNAAITVPKDAINGRTRCDITFTAPAAGMVQMAIGVPITVNVINGTNPTPTPKITVVQAKEPAITTIQPTATHTMIKPTATAIKPIEQAPAPDYTPDMSFSLLFAVSLIVIGVMGVFIALMMWWKK